jgi:acetylornithine/N-succinyldiaminopimelate aminotransferase
VTAGAAATGAGGSATDSGAAILTRYGEAIMGTYGAPTRALVRGEGNYVWDADGRRYLDLLGGIAVNAIGYAHPAWVKAVTEQAGTLAHVSNFFATGPQVALAERLLDLAHAPAGSRVFLCSTGTEANEAALKAAHKTGRRVVVALEGGFHGRTVGALAVTHKPAIREPFGPFGGEVRFVVPGDAPALERAMTGEVAAIILETIQGEAGVRPLGDAFLAAARRLCDQHGALLIIDEVQTGIGRTGTWFSHQAHGIAPDLLTLAKGLGGGFPIGAVLAYGERAATLLTRGDHGSTFGGNPLACAAALATLDVIENEGLIENAKTVGEHLRSGALALPGVADVRGEGLMLGIVLNAAASPDTVAPNIVAADVVAAAIEAGFIINAPQADTIRLVPALTLSAAEADTFLAWLGEHLATSAAGTATTKETDS